MEIGFSPKVYALVDEKGKVVAYRLGVTNFPVFSDQSEVDVFYYAVVPSLEMKARRAAIELKDAHVEDDIIESIVHEGLHLALAKIEIPGTVTEEAVVDRISVEVMEGIRQLPRLKDEPTYDAARMREAFLTGRLREVRVRRRPDIPVRRHKRRTPL